MIQLNVQFGFKQSGFHMNDLNLKIDQEVCWVLWEKAVLENPRLAGCLQRL